MDKSSNGVEWRIPKCSHTHVDDICLTRMQMQLTWEGFCSPKGDWGILLCLEVEDVERSTEVRQGWESRGRRQGWVITHVKTSATYCAYNIVYLYNYFSLKLKYFYRGKKKKSLRADLQEMRKSVLNGWEVASRTEY